MESMIKTVDSSETIEINDEFERAFRLCEKTQSHVFITGKAGTGKSTLLKYFRENTKKNVVVLAPTGVAAVNVKGQTIHSFFRFKPDITPDSVSSIRIRKAQRQIYKNIDTIVIDEVSMVRADLLDCVDQFLRLHACDRDLPFGGVQVVMFGDLYQLPPVVTSADREIFSGAYASPYFFDSNVFENLNYKFVELDKIYRQKEEDFIQILAPIHQYMTFLNRLLQDDTI